MKLDGMTNASEYYQAMGFSRAFPWFKFQR